MRVGDQCPRYRGGYSIIQLLALNLKGSSLLQSQSAEPIIYNPTIQAIADWLEQLKNVQDPHLFIKDG